MFWRVPLSMIRSFSLYTQQWYMSYMFADSLRAGSELFSQIYFWNKTLYVLHSSSVHHHEFFTVHTAMAYVIPYDLMTYTIAVCTVRKSWWWTAELSETCGVLFQKKIWEIHTTCHAYDIWHIPLLCVQWKTPDDGKRNCPKHVEFYSKNKFEKYIGEMTCDIYHCCVYSEKVLMMDRRTVRNL